MNLRRATRNRSGQSTSTTFRKDGWGRRSRSKLAHETRRVNICSSRMAMCSSRLRPCAEMAYAAMTQADHVVVFPTPEVKGRGEGLMLSFFAVLGMWITRPWRVSDPLARHDVIGVGAFNLVRREALEVLGGWEPQRLAVVEDVTLGRRMKAAGVR